LSACYRCAEKLTVCLAFGIVCDDWVIGLESKVAVARTAIRRSIGIDLCFWGMKQVTAVEGQL